MKKRRPIQVLVYPVRRFGAEWEVLLLKRVESRGGFWQGVTGGVEWDEELREAADRELHEETDYTTTALVGLDYSYAFPVREEWRSAYDAGVEEIVEYVFLAQVSDADPPTIDSQEHDEWRWCTFEEALSQLIWSENIEALRRCRRYLETQW
ncbi:MAG: NUDIX domain-containing protein [Anaerolineales bacterium]|nr:NUDIX domain-containing protein [Anaerolineales bacterium]